MSPSSNNKKALPPEGRELTRGTTLLRHGDPPAGRGLCRAPGVAWGSSPITGAAGRVLLGSRPFQGQLGGHFRQGRGAASQRGRLSV